MKKFRRGHGYVDPLYLLVLVFVVLVIAMFVTGEWRFYDHR